MEWQNIQAGEAWSAANTEIDDLAARLCSDYSLAGAILIDHRLDPRRKMHWDLTALFAAQRLKRRDAEGKHIGELAEAYSFLDESQHAVALFNQQLSIAQEVKDLDSEIAALGSLSRLYRDLNASSRSIEYLNQLLRLAGQGDNQQYQWITLQELGIAQLTIGNYRDAIKTMEEMLAPPSVNCFATMYPFPASHLSVIRL